MTSRRHLLIVALLITSGVLPSVAVAQAKQMIKGKGPAYLEPPEDEPCYPLMGEFVGEIQVGEDQKEWLGLQIRPVGGDQFDALSFAGGLPGQDKHKPEPIRMIGRRSDDFLILSGGPWAIFVEQASCLLVDRKGNKIGTLDRIQRSSPTLGARPPQGATVIFDGTHIDQFTDAQMTKTGLLMQGALIKPMFQDFNLHLEFRLPYMPEADGQSRGNSGLYLQSRYECQVLDSFGLQPLYNGCGALYRFRKPDLNMCLPPLVWQTYDVQFTAPRWAADGTKIRDAHISSWLNGVKIHDNVALPNKTGAGAEEEPVLSPIKIQDHGDPVRFRNIWIVDRGLATGDFPVFPTPEEIAAAKAEQEKKQQQEAEKQRKAEEEKKAAEAKAKADPEQAEPKAAEMKDDKPQPPQDAAPPVEQAEKKQQPPSQPKPAADQKPAPKQQPGTPKQPDSPTQPDPKQAETGKKQPGTPDPAGTPKPPETPKPQPDPPQPPKGEPTGPPAEPNQQPKTEQPKTEQPGAE